jgi:hypothetical protein
MRTNDRLEAVSRVHCASADYEPRARAGPAHLDGVCEIARWAPLIRATGATVD